MDRTSIFFTDLEDPTPGLYVLSRNHPDRGRTEILRIPLRGAEFQAPAWDQAGKQSLVRALGDAVSCVKGANYRMHRALLKRAVVSVAHLSTVDKLDGSARILHSTPDQLLTRMFHHPKLLARATPHDIDLLVNKCQGSIASPEQPHPQQAILLHWETDRAAVEKLGRSMFLVLSLVVQLSSTCIG
ncbi:hypothetical protein PG995_004064 [Apiospora arundinis]